MDKAGDMAFGYSESNASTLHPSIAFTGRVPTDPLNTMESPATHFHRERFGDRGESLGRLQQHGHRSVGRLHFLVHKPVHSQDGEEGLFDFPYAGSIAQVSYLPVGKASEN